MARDTQPGRARGRTATVEALADVVPRLYRLLRTALDEDPDVPSLEQLRVLQRIDEGLHHASALAAARQMRMSAITSLLDGIAQRGWVERRPDPTDRRRTDVELTRTGRRSLERGRRLVVERVRDILTDYEGDAATLAAVVGGLVGAVARYDRRAR